MNLPFVSKTRTILSELHDAGITKLASLSTDHEAWKKLHQAIRDDRDFLAMREEALMCEVSRLQEIKNGLLSANLDEQMDHLIKIATDQKADRQLLGGLVRSVCLV